MTAAPVNHYVSNLLFSQCSSNSKIGVNDAHYKGTIEGIIILFKVSCHIWLKKRRQVPRTFTLFSHFLSILISPDECTDYLLLFVGQVNVPNILPGDDLQLWTMTNNVRRCITNNAVNSEVIL